MFELLISFSMRMSNIIVSVIRYALVINPVKHDIFWILKEEQNYNLGIVCSASFFLSWFSPALLLFLYQAGYSINCFKWAMLHLLDNCKSWRCSCQSCHLVYCPCLRVLDASCLYHWSDWCFRYFHCSLLLT